MLSLLSASLSHGHASPTSPHIVFVVADDLGWNDVGFHGSKQIRTPQLDKLAAEGVTLDRYYVQPECSPTRSSILSGRHVIHSGVQGPMAGGHTVDYLGRPYGLSLEYSLLPQLLKEHFGYHTIMVGKWHLGFVSPAFLPQQRGFDRFFGYYTGVQDYWGHFDDETFGLWGASMHEDDGPVYSSTGSYTSELFLATAQKYIAEYAKNTSVGTPPAAAQATGASAARRAGADGAALIAPLFIYFALQSIHSANNKHLQAPQPLLASASAIAARISTVIPGAGASSTTFW